MKLKSNNSHRPRESTLNNKKRKTKPVWLTKSQLWCYEKVLMVQLLTMLAIEPIIAKL